MAIIKPSDLDALNKRNEFLTYKGTGNKNILFIGSCRLSPIMYYLSLLRPELNLFCIYVPFWGTQWNLDPQFPFPSKEINKFLPKTDVIVTESVKNNQILNTSRKYQQNFFDEFNVNLEEIRLPNYVVSMYLYDLVNSEIKDDCFILCDETKVKCKDIFNKSRERLSASIKKSGFDAVDSFLSEHFSNMKMFSTINHPTTIVSMLTFKIMAERLGIAKELLTFDFFKHISKHHFLSGNSTPITHFDIENYGFKFNTKVFDDDIVKVKNFTYPPSEEENFISDDQIRTMMKFHH